MVPAAPTEKHTVLAGQLTPVMLLAVGEVGTRLQLVPPLAVVSVVPEAPPAMHPLVDQHETPSRPLLVPEVCADQLEPLLAVAITVPLAPVATQTLVLGQLIAFSAAETPELSVDQLDPLFVVVRISPPAPTA
jgi:hypothetical protein